MSLLTEAFASASIAMDEAMGEAWVYSPQKSPGGGRAVADPGRPVRSLTAILLERALVGDLQGHRMAANTALPENITTPALDMAAGTLPFDPCAGDLATRTSTGEVFRVNGVLPARDFRMRLSLYRVKGP